MHAGDREDVMAAPSNESQHIDDLLKSIGRLIQEHRETQASIDALKAKTEERINLTVDSGLCARPQRSM